MAGEYADKVEGLGIAGTPNGGVLSVQGVGGGTALPISGAVTVSGTVAATQSGAWAVDVNELAAAVAAADALANPTTAPVVAVVEGWNGAQWDRLRALGDDTDGVAQGTLGRLLAVARNSLYTGASTWDRQRGTDGHTYGDHPATLSVTVTGGANAVATATLPAAGAGLFHFITHISIRRVATAALAGAAILAVTTTNLGGRSWRTGNQASITVSTFDGGLLLDQEYVHPLQSAAANTATTIVAPAAGAAVSWQIVVDYFVGRG